MSSHRADLIAADVKETAPSAESMAGELLHLLGQKDPVEAVCALAIAASHFIVTVATEGESTLPAHQRLQPAVQRELLQRVTELCQDTRLHGAN